MIKYFTDPFGPLFNFPPKQLSIAEPAPLKTSVGGDSGNDESYRQPVTSVGPEKGSSLMQSVSIVPEEKPKSEEQITQVEAAKKKKTSGHVKAKTIKKVQKIEREKDMEKKYHEDHHEEKCCYFPEVPVVLKGFEWCDYEKYCDYIREFEEYIKKYMCEYPCVLISYKKIYPSKCKVRFCVFFSLCDYEKAFEIEEKLQKIYRDMKMHKYEY